MRFNNTAKNIAVGIILGISWSIFTYLNPKAAINIPNFCIFILLSFVVGIYLKYDLQKNSENSIFFEDIIRTENQFSISIILPIFLFYIPFIINSYLDIIGTGDVLSTIILMVTFFAVTSLPLFAVFFANNAAGRLYCRFNKILSIKNKNNQPDKKTDERQKEIKKENSINYTFSVINGVFGILVFLFYLILYRYYLPLFRELTAIGVSWYIMLVLSIILSTASESLLVCLSFFKIFINILISKNIFKQDLKLSFEKIKKNIIISGIVNIIFVSFIYMGILYLKINYILFVIIIAIMIILLENLKLTLILWFEKFEKMIDNEKIEKWKDLAANNNIKVYPIFIKPDPLLLKGNAYAFGFKNFGCIFITKNFFENLNPEQFSAIMAHETSHLENNDCILKTLFWIIRFATFICLIHYALIFYHHSLAYIKHYDFTNIFLTFYFILFSLIFWVKFMKIFSNIQKNFELRSDYFSAKVLNTGRFMTEALLYLYGLQEVNEAEHTEFYRDSVSSTHPALKERIKRLASYKLQ